MEQNQNCNSIKEFIKKTAIVVIGCCIVILFYNYIVNGDGLGAVSGKIFSVFQSIIIGLVLAFIMNPIMMFIERWIYPIALKVQKKPIKAKKLARGISAVFSAVIVVGIVALFFISIIPEIYSTAQYLLANIGNQVDSVLDWVNSVTRNNYHDEITAIKESSFADVFDTAITFAQRYIDFTSQENVIAIAGGVYSFIRIFLNCIIGLFVAVYALCSKELFKAQSKKIVYSFFSLEHANIVIRVTRKTTEIFYGFITGKIIDSIIIGLLCYIGMIILGFPYPLLVSMIIGITNIIPVFGPYIGAVPTTIIIFLTDPRTGLYFLIFVLALQQIDGNLIGPKILGESTGLTSFWVVVAIVVGGALFGIPGMIIGVPVTATLYYCFGRFVRYRLRERKLPDETIQYLKLDHINAKTYELIMHTDEAISKKDIKTETSEKKEGN